MISASDAYLRNRSIANRNALVVALAPRINGIAAHFWRSLPKRTVPLEDLKQVAQMAAVKAVERYDPASVTKKGFDASRYHIQHFIQAPVRGAMVDYLRSVDHLSRYDRKRYIAGECVNGAVHQCPMPDARQWEHWSGRHTHRFKYISYVEKEPEEGFDSLLSLLPMGNVREMVRLRFVEGLNNIEIGARLGISANHTGRKIADGLEVLRVRLGQRGYN